MSIKKLKADYNIIEIQYNESAITNILSYNFLTDSRRIVNNSATYSLIFYQLEDKNWFEFKKIGYQFYTFNTVKSKTNKLIFISYLLV